jgi:hypothetical protein
MEVQNIIWCKVTVFLNKTIINSEILVKKKTFFGKKLKYITFSLKFNLAFGYFIVRNTPLATTFMTKIFND